MLPHPHTQCLRSSTPSIMAVELLSVSPSPSREQDVFGNELRLSGGCLNLSCFKTNR